MAIYTIVCKNKYLQIRLEKKKFKKIKTEKKTKLETQKEDKIGNKKETKNRNQKENKRETFIFFLVHHFYLTKKTKISRKEKQKN